MKVFRKAESKIHWLVLNFFIFSAFINWCFNPDEGFSWNFSPVKGFLTDTYIDVINIFPHISFILYIFSAFIYLQKQLCWAARFLPLYNYFISRCSDKYKVFKKFNLIKNTSTSFFIMIHFIYYKSKGNMMATLKYSSKCDIVLLYYIALTQMNTTNKYHYWWIHQLFYDVHIIINPLFE